MAETESFESQKIVTEEPIKQVHDGEQDNISPVEEASESTEAPSEASTKAEDEILLEDSTVDDSAEQIAVSLGIIAELLPQFVAAETVVDC